MTLRSEVVKKQETGDRSRPATLPKKAGAWIQVLEVSSELVFSVGRSNGLIRERSSMFLKSSVLRVTRGN